jgi:hypothetical protein
MGLSEFSCKLIVRAGDGELNSQFGGVARYFQRLATYSNYLNGLQDSSQHSLGPGALKLARACTECGELDRGVADADTTRKS